MWASAAPAVRAGAAAPDPWLSRRAEDGRRGVTLLARPDAAVAGRLGALLAALRRLEPAQHYQPEADLHHTVLSLFTATPDHAPYLARVPAYRDAVREAAAATPPFAVDVRGVTLSAGAVLAQGFPRDGTLDAFRDRLRAALARRGVGDTVDGRYRLVTAHMTLVRFAAPLARPGRFVDALAAARDAEFGTTVVRGVELVFSDWYHTAAIERQLAAYPLRAPAPSAPAAR
jgi:2'-5' RNA ligase